MLSFVGALLWVISLSLAGYYFGNLPFVRENFSLVIFAIIFIWQPPHFYAIALHRRADYAEARFPMLHDRIGEDATRTRIVLWILALVPVTLAPVALGMLGLAYAVIAGALGLWFLGEALVLRRRRDRESARRTFLVSLVYLLGTFAGMIGDLVWRSVA